MVSALELLALLAFASPGSALTVLQYRGDDCITLGDPAIYGPGVRAGFYLQWIASLLALLFAPRQYSGSRVAGAAVLWAILVSSINSTLYFNYPHDVDDERFIFTLANFEWTIVAYLIIGLFGANIPIGKAQMTQAAGAWIAAAFAGCVAWGALFHVYWTSLHDQGNFSTDSRFVRTANEDISGCSVRVALLAPINAYSPGWVTFNKVITIVACLVYIPLFVLFAIRLLHFSLKYGSYGEELSPATTSNRARYIVATLLFLSGVVSIVSIEVMISGQKVVFDQFSLFSQAPFFSITAQLAALFVGLIAFFTVLWEIAQGKMGGRVGSAPPPPDFWSAGYAMKMVRLKR